MKSKFYIVPIFLFIGLGGFFLAQSLDGSGDVESDGQIDASEPLSEIEYTTDSEIVVLEDGDSYVMTAEMVVKELDGNVYSLMAYNGSIPGPTLKVKQGSTVTVEFINNTTIENTIHSHGLRLANEYDGVPDLTQEAVQPGESFTYELTFPDAGVFWYHPHVREDMTQEMGLYGAFVVEPESEEYWNEVNREEFVFLDDYLISGDSLETFYDDKVTHTIMGRYGNEMLINGEEQYDLTVNQNEVVRFAFLNVANVRPFNVQIEDMDLKLVGSDGGTYESETMVDSVILGPSERYLVEVLFDTPGEYELQHVTPNDTYVLGSITVLDSPISNDLSADFGALETTTNIRDEIPNFDSYFEKEVDKDLRLTVDMDAGLMAMMSMGSMPCHQMPDGSWMGDCEEDGGGHGMHGGEIEPIEWEDDMIMMNELSTDENVEWQIVDEETGAINDEIDWDFELGDWVLINLNNDEESMHPMQHPIHFHGQRFVVISQNGEKNENLVWKDTVLVSTGDEIQILLEVSNPGEWMAHCHIAEHMHSGMMFDFSVE